MDLQARIDEAAAALSQAPDVLRDSYSKGEVDRIIEANRTAWFILTAGKYPESRGRRQNYLLAGE